MMANRSVSAQGASAGAECGVRSDVAGWSAIVSTGDVLTTDVGNFTDDQKIGMSDA